MKGELTVFCAATLCFVASGADPGGGVKRGSYPQDGVWKPISAAFGGSKVPVPGLRAISLRISGGQYEVSVPGEKEPDRGKHLLDENANPKRITITSTNGPNKGKTFLGIYEVKETNSLRVCYDLSGTEFPTKFESTGENGYYLAEYRRIQMKAERKPTDAVEDAKRQNGIWKPAGGMLSGRKLGREELSKIRFTIKDGNYETVVDGASQTDRGTITLDTSVSPKQMTIQGTAGPSKGKTILAIYEMGETGGQETFRICYDLSGKAFPKDFSSPKGSMHYLVGYRREKSAPAKPNLK